MFTVVPAEGGGGDDSGATLGRGAMRGRRIIIPELHTRPSNLVTKIGEYICLCWYMYNIRISSTHNS